MNPYIYFAAPWVIPALAAWSLTMMVMGALP
jgi:hypothetical protein